MIPAGDLSYTYYLRWKVSDAVSNEDEGTVYSEFQVTISDKCHSNSLTLGNSNRGIEDFSYVMTTGSSTPLNKAFDYIESVSDCPTSVAVTCEVLLSPEDDWVPIDTCLDTDTVTDTNGLSCASYTAAPGAPTCGAADGGGFVASTHCCYCGGGVDANTDVTCDTGAFVVDKIQAQEYLPEKFIDYRIRYEAPDSLLSEDEGKVVYDYVTVRFMDACSDLLVEIEEMEDATYFVKSTNAVAT